MKDPDKLLHLAQGPLKAAHHMVEHGSDTAGGRYARYFAHHDLRALLNMAAGYRKAERPLKLYLHMLEKKGIEHPPQAVLEELSMPDPIDIYNEKVVNRINKMPLQPKTEEDRIQGLAIIETIRAFTNEHWVFPNEDEQKILHVISALHLSYVPADGDA